MTTDCVIIGAGHNGLVAAWYLARAGLKVHGAGAPTCPWAAGP